MLRIGVLTAIPTLFRDLKTKLPHLTFIECKTGHDEALRSSEIVIADYDLLGPVIYDLPDAKWVQGTWAGVDKLIPHLNKGAPNMTITRFSGSHFGRIISEYVVACIVNHEREFYQIQENQKDSKWTKQGKILNYRIISDLTVGIMGIGSIGSRLGETLSFLGAAVVGYGRRPEVNISDYQFLTEYFSQTKFEAFLCNCDVIVNTLPDTSETRGLLNNKILSNCKERQALFINVGRGSVVGEEDLEHAIKEKWLSGACLDVFSIEPLPESSKLWALPQVRITPHVAAVSRSRDIVEQFAENFMLYQMNKPFPTEFNFERGY